MLFMRKKYIVALLVVVAMGTMKVMGQRAYGVQEETWAVGPMVGGSNYLGDIGTSSSSERPFIMDMQLSRTRFMVGGFARYQPPLSNANLFLRGNLIYAQVSGDDALSKYQPRRNRNLSFTSDIIELSVVAEYMVFSADFVTGGFGRGTRHEIALFGYGGVGMIYFSPRTKYKGNWVRLKPLSTEGQGVIDGKDKYSSFQPVFPMGGEFTYSPNPTVYTISLNFGWRFTFTDYLDDVSTTYPDNDKLRKAKGKTAAELSIRADERDNYESIRPYHSGGAIRGDPSDNDSYGFLSIGFNYYIKQKGRVMTPSF